MYTWIELSRQAVAENVHHFIQLLGKERFAPVLKANAYGHGVNEIYQILADFPIKWLCFNEIDEAAHIRSLGYRGRVLVMGPTSIHDLERAAKLDTDIFMNSPEHLKAWLNLKSKPRIHLKFDTGMSRQGFAVEQAESLAHTLSPYRDLLQGLCTHFANVEDVVEPEYSQLQLHLFEQARVIFEANQLIPPFLHCASSASALLLPQSRYNLSRIGISLYGMWPSKTTRLSYLQQNGQLFPLKPVLTWKTRIAQIKRIRAGKYVGYGCAYRALKDMNIAVLPLGYFEGVPRLIADHHSHVLIHGQPCPQIGRICMNMMMVDISHLEAVNLDEVVTLIGRDGNEEISALDFGLWAQTINYEVTTRLHPGIERRIVE